MNSPRSDPDTDTFYFIRQMLCELTDISSKNNLGMLPYLLSMAIAELDDLELEAIQGAEIMPEFEKLLTGNKIDM
jgi:hypothetical protein